MAEDTKSSKSAINNLLGFEGAVGIDVSAGSSVVIWIWWRFDCSFSSYQQCADPSGWNAEGQASWNRWKLLDGLDLAGRERAGLAGKEIYSVFSVKNTGNFFAKTRSLRDLCRMMRMRMRMMFA